MGRIRLQSAAVITIAVPVMLAVAAPCSATSLTVLGALYGIQVGTGTTLFEQDLFFSAPRFDPSLGTLDSMLLTLIRGAVNVSITVDSESPFSALVAQDSVTAVANTKITY